MDAALFVCLYKVEISIMKYTNNRAVPARLNVSGRTVLIGPFASREIEEDIQGLPTWITKEEAKKPKAKKVETKKVETEKNPVKETKKTSIFGSTKDKE